jgi:hypothetical protein
MVVAGGAKVVRHAFATTTLEYQYDQITLDAAFIKNRMGIKL